MKYVNWCINKWIQLYFIVIIESTAINAVVIKNHGPRIHIRCNLVCVNCAYNYQILFIINHERWTSLNTFQL